MTRRPLRLASPRGAATIAAFVSLCVWPCTFHAQGGTSTPTQMFERAEAREQVARSRTPPSAKDLRLAATAYEQLFRAYPASGYADNSLWQAASLLSLAF